MSASLRSVAAISSAPRCSGDILRDASYSALVLRADSRKLAGSHAGGDGKGGGSFDPAEVEGPDVAAIPESRSPGPARCLRQLALLHSCSVEELGSGTTDKSKLVQRCVTVQRLSGYGYESSQGYPGAPPMRYYARSTLSSSIVGRYRLYVCVTVPLHDVADLLQ